MADEPSSVEGSIPTEESRALARAVTHAFLAVAYRYPMPPSTEELNRLGEALPHALALLAAFGSEVQTRFSELRATSWDRETREAEHVRLFGHAPEGRCPPYEGQYGEPGEGLLMPHELSDLMAFYRAFGLELSRRAHERMDFIAVECEFFSFLCRKQAYSEEIGDAALAAVTVDAQRKFFKEHLGRWSPAFCRLVLQQPGEGFFPALARFTLTFMLDECRRLGVQPGADHLRLRVAVPERDGGYECPQSVGCAEDGAEESGPSFPV